MMRKDKQKIKLPTSLFWRQIRINSRGTTSFFPMESGNSLVDARYDDHKDISKGLSGSSSVYGSCTHFIQVLITEWLKNFLCDSWGCVALFLLPSWCCVKISLSQHGRSKVQGTDQWWETVWKWKVCSKVMLGIPNKTTGLGLGQGQNKN